MLCFRAVQAVSTALQQVEKEKVKQAFLDNGITIALDGSQDHLVRVEIDGKYIKPNASVPQYPVAPPSPHRDAASLEEKKEAAEEEEKEATDSDSDSSDSKDDGKEVDLFVPERIVGERRGQYKIKWKDYAAASNTWEPMKEFAGRAYAELRADWQQRKAAKSCPKKRKAASQPTQKSKAVAQGMTSEVKRRKMKHDPDFVY